MAKARTPDSIRQFVEQQKTLPVENLGENQAFPYVSYWYRAVACILLSGQVQAKSDGAPNMTDVNRVGKEANFNQYLTERIGKLLIAMDVVQHDRPNQFKPGPNLTTFWDKDPTRFPVIIREGVLRLAHYQRNQRFWYSKGDKESYLIEFLTLFFSTFQGLALVESEVGQVFHAFSLLPEVDLIQAGQTLGLALDEVKLAEWRRWLDPKGQKALITALNMDEWAYGAHAKKSDWYFASPLGLAMLELGPRLPTPELATELRVQSDLSVFAGAGLAWEQLVTLFRYSTIKRIDQVFEFRLDRKRIASSSASSQPGKELRDVFPDVVALPSTVADLLGTKPRAGGKLGIRWCSALIKPENAETLAAIHDHPRLKGYLEPGAPPSYLLLKSRSDPHNFILRCRDLGFEVTSM
ncbi:hypothetical protein V5E97_14790 [Singulisphaera sp. Ch08]|uniref:Helicase XPB/Ssl2 N-terminal domain-containing protein n=1 Tax=Singulisphaera sp. Ch08 TaxID=3120278 RepID=A0AAU7CQ62_9BACT